MQFILSLLRALAASIPSQVDAILMRIFSLGMSFSSYRAMSLFAFSIVAYLSKLSLASTSVETTPGTRSRILFPNWTDSWSQIMVTSLPWFSGVSSAQTTGCLGFSSSSMVLSYDFPFPLVCETLLEDLCWTGGFTIESKLSKPHLIASSIT